MVCICVFAWGKTAGSFKVVAGDGESGSLKHVPEGVRSIGNAPIFPICHDVVYREYSEHLLDKIRELRSFPEHGVLGQEVRKRNQEVVRLYFGNICPAVIGVCEETQVLRVLAMLLQLHGYSEETSLAWVSSINVLGGERATFRHVLCPSEVADAFLSFNKCVFVGKEGVRFLGRTQDWGGSGLMLNSDKIKGALVVDYSRDRGAAYPSMLPSNKTSLPSYFHGETCPPPPQYNSNVRGVSFVPLLPPPPPTGGPPPYRSTY